MRVPKRIHIDHLLIFLIVIIGAILRFYDYGTIPFTHDEFSAIFRTQFSNFHDLISKGVEVDTHPAGVQIFLYYWVKLTGISEPLVKLPFTVFSLISVYLVYRIGKTWFSAASGLIAASFLAFLQYPVMYGQIARPYASGLFLALLMVYFWTNLMLSPDRKYYWNLTAYILVSALCAYNHHFTLLFCGIVALTGIFMISRYRRLSFMGSLLMIFVLYIPHLSIFFSQLKQGGIGGWLSKPRPDFILDYLSYILQFSWYVYALVFVLAVLSLIWRTRSEKPNSTLVLISFLWFLFPLLIGFLYSFYINPVLQYSVLIFSFPFLLLFAFSYSNTEKAWQKILLVGLCATIIIPSLIFERKHYRLFYNSPYRAIVTEAVKAADSLGRGNCFILLDSYNRFTDYYLEKPGMKGVHINYRHDVLEPSVTGLIVDTCTAPFFVYGCISNAKWEDYQVIQAKYPYLMIHKCLNEGDFYVFSRDSIPALNEDYFTSDIDFVSNKSGWLNFQPTALWFTGHDLKTPVYSMDSSLEFSPTFRGSLRDICKHNNDVIDFSAEIETDQGFTEAYMQVCMYQKDKLTSFQSATISGDKPGETRKVFCSYRLADFDWRHHSLGVQVYIWNPKKQNFIIRRMTFRLRQGNPFLYSLYRKIEI